MDINFNDLVKMHITFITFSTMELQNRTLKGIKLINLILALPVL